MTNDVSPYLQRPVRKLEEVIAEAEQQRLEQGPTASVADAEKPEAAPSVATAR